MKQVDSDALDDVFRALGLKGAVGATTFTDGILDQVLDVAPLVRRGRTLGNSEGIFEGVFHNSHAGAGSLTSTTTPYNIPVGSVRPWPVPVPRGLDVWILKAHVFQVSGAGTFKGALFTNYDAAAQAWGISNSGTGVGASNQTALINWDALETDTFAYGVLNGEVPTIRPFRLLRGINPGSSLLFSSTASDVAVFQCQVLVGLFPVGLGQDVSV